MKTTASLLLVLSIVLSADAQGTFRSSLTPVAPTPENSWIPATAEFSLDGSSVGFVISFGLESVVPTSAHLGGAGADFVFDLGSPQIAIHSPGPWPNGYDGATAFYGSFTLPDTLRDDFLAGSATLQLLGSVAGDFSGAVLPVPEPSSLALLLCSLTAIVLTSRRRFWR